jgi:hypothetical protein
MINKVETFRVFDKDDKDRSQHVLRRTAKKDVAGLRFILGEN